MFRLLFTWSHPAVLVGSALVLMTLVNSSLTIERVFSYTGSSLIPAIYWIAIIILSSKYSLTPLYQLFVIKGSVKIGKYRRIRLGLYIAQALVCLLALAGSLLFIYDVVSKSIAKGFSLTLIFSYVLYLLPFFLSIGIYYLIVHGLYSRNIQFNELTKGSTEEVSVPKINLVFLNVLFAKGKIVLHFLLLPIRWWWRNFSLSKKFRQNHYIALFILLLGALAYFTWIITRPVTLTPDELRNDYQLIRDTVPLDGPIVVRLPEGEGKFLSRFNVDFDPSISTWWGRTTSPDYIVFKLSEPLEENNFYTLSYENSDGSISEKRFRAVQRPKIDLFEPNLNVGNVSEETILTFTFNRPMVPLQALDRDYEIDVPITITPPTEGSFVWASERQLEFIPAKRLTRSSDYTVTVGEGFYSVDGLQVPKEEYNFTVNRLRTTEYSRGNLRAQDPLRFSFNQPVSIEDMEIAVVNKDNNSIPVTLEYDSSLTYNPDLKQKENVIDRSTVIVRPVENEARWFFGESISYTVTNIRPTEGTLTSPDIRATSTVANLLMRSDVYSQRSREVRSDYFDPQGVIRLYFSQPVDKDKLTISGVGRSVATVKYQSLCEAYDPVCNRYNDSVVEVSFVGEQLELAKDYTLTISDFFDLDGVRIADVKEEVKFKTVGPLVITEVIPTAGSEDRSLTVCSSNPIIEYRSLNYKDLFQTEQPIYSFSRSEISSFVTPYETLLPLQSQPLCAGSFKTTVQFSLLPETDYVIKLTPEDVFGNQLSTETSFRTPERVKPVVTEIKKVAWMKNLHQRYEVTTPDRTAFTYSFGNIDYIDLTICKLSPEEMLRIGGELGRGQEAPSNCLERQDRRIDLSNPSGTSYVQLDLQQYFNNVKGHYVITVTHPELKYSDYQFKKNTERQYFDHMYTSVTNLSLVEKRTNQFDLNSEEVTDRKTGIVRDGAGSGLYWVSNLSTLDPVEGAQISVYRDTAPGNKVLIERAATVVTNEDGVGLVKTVADAVGAYVISGDDSAMVSSWADTISSSGAVHEIEQMYLYTDRPIYRPGHEVFIKGLHRIGYDAKYEIFADRIVTVTVSGPGGQIFSTSTSLSEYGTVAAELVLPENAPLGSYSIHAQTWSGYNVGYSYFSVEEYTPSPFEVKATSQRDEYVAGETLDVIVSADYFFGAPVAEGTVSYAITTQNYYFDKGNDRRFRYGSFDEYCSQCGYYDQFVARGEVPLENGVANILTELDFNKLFEDEENSNTSKIFVINATVKDASGRSVSTQASFIVHRAMLYGAVRTLDHFSAVGESNIIEIRTVDTEGVGRPGKVNMEIVREDWKQFERREVDGSFYVHSEEIEVPVFDAEVTTNQNGLLELPFTFDKAGRYILRLSGVDERGNPYLASASQYVYGKGAVPVRRNNDRTLDIAVDEVDLAVGQTSKLIIKSPYQKAKALVTVERGSVMEYEVIDVDANFFDYDFVAKKDHSPNVVVTVTLISSEPSVKYGEVYYQIDHDVYNLDINVISNKKAYLPGEEVTLQVETKNNDGLPVPAEVSIAAVDLSVLALKGNPKRDPLAFFYNRFSHDVITSSNLKFVHEEIEIPTGTKGGDGGVDLAKRERGVFKDTAFWAADVVTDSNGRATVKFTLPDNLTRWQVETIGITKDTKVGVNYMEFEEKKDLIMTPLYPRFLVPGDKLSLGAEVLNRTKVSQTITFTIESDSLVLVGKPQTVTIPAEGSKRLFFDVEAPRSILGGSHEVLFVAGNSLFEDSVRKQIPVVENTLYETVFRGAQTSGELIEEKIFTPTEIHQELGGVTVKAFGTVGAYLEDSLNYMAAYPYGCSEQLASKLATLATISHLTSLEGLGSEYRLETVEFNNNTYSVNEALQQGLKQIYESQARDGGFGYYRGLRSDVSLSLHVLSVLLSLEKYGIEIDEDVLNQAKKFAGTVASRRFNEDSIVDSSWKMDYLTTRLVTLKEIDPRPRAVDVGVSELRKSITRKAIRNFSTHSLVYAALLSDELWFWDRYTVWNEIERRLRENNDGIYISRSSVSFAKSFYETDMANTAILLRAITTQERETDLAPKIVDWLLSERQFDGAWGTTNTTHVVVQTLTDYIEWKGESGARTVITALLDGEIIATHNTELQPKLEGLSKLLTFDELGLGEEHLFTFTQVEADARQNNTIYYDIEMKYYLDREVLPGRDEGVQVTREFFALDDIDKQNPLTEATVGDTVLGRITFSIGSPMRMMAIEDKIPAGFEIINFDYSTENKIVLDAAIKSAAKVQAENKFDVAAFMSTGEFAALETVDVYKDEKEALKPNRRQYTRAFRGGTEELHDDRIFVFQESLDPGTYVYEYYLRTLVPGQYQHLPVWVGELYNPEFFGRTASGEFTVVK